MRQALLVSVAAIALAAGSTLALSQGGGGQGPAGPGGGASGGATGSMSKDSQSTIDSGPQKKGAQERTAPPSQKSTQDRQDRPAQPGTQQRQTEPPAQQRQTESPAQPGGKQDKSAQQPGGKQDKSAQEPGAKQGTAQGAGQRPMTSSNVSLTVEQKTTIRNTVVNSGPKVTNVNFDISVGTVVPRTVRVAPVPATLIEIQPEWRGHMYFVYADEIIIVDARTLKIIAVIEI